MVRTHVPVVRAGLDLGRAAILVPDSLTGMPEFERLRDLRFLETEP